MCSGPPSAGRLVILVPYRDRKNYLDILLREVPCYVERANGISDYAIYVAEQQGEDLFNLALSRNVAARAALDDGVSGYFVFHDVDVIPVCGVDYGPRPKISLYRTSPEGQTVRVLRKALPYGAMIHDFAITPTKVIVVIAPITLPTVPVARVNAAAAS